MKNYLFDYEHFSQFRRAIVLQDFFPLPLFQDENCNDHWLLRLTQAQRTSRLSIAESRRTGMRTGLCTVKRGCARLGDAAFDERLIPWSRKGADVLS